MLSSYLIISSKMYVLSKSLGSQGKETCIKHAVAVRRVLQQGAIKKCEPPRTGLKPPSHFPFFRVTAGKGAVRRGCSTHTHRHTGVNLLDCCSCCSHTPPLCLSVAASPPHNSLNLPWMFLHTLLTVLWVGMKFSWTEVAVMRCKYVWLLLVLLLSLSLPQTQIDFRLFFYSHCPRISLRSALAVAGACMPRRWGYLQHR